MTAGFILKKMIATLLMPLPIGILLMALALYFLYRDKRRRAIGTLLTAITWLTLLSYGPVANTLLHPLETIYPPLLQAPKNIKYIYVLGSGHNSDSTLPITSQIGDDGIIRLNEAIRLYYQLDERPKIIVSGFSGYYSTIPHALMQQKLALALGVKSDRIITIPDPVDTQEEAKAAKKLLKNNAFILVTSAYHMARAMQWFKQEGLDPAPAPTRHYTNTQEIPYYQIFSVTALNLSTIAIHESIGMVWQKIKSLL